MSTSYVSAELRRLVQARADYLCEYCLIRETDTYYGCHVDHIISEKHGGHAEAENLAYACMYCNLHKGSDIASLTHDGSLCRLFHPRLDRWQEHFALRDSEIVPLTSIL